jgi:hypothetical protein
MFPLLSMKDNVVFVIVAFVYLQLVWPSKSLFHHCLTIITVIILPCGSLLLLPLPGGEEEKDERSTMSSSLLLAPPTRRSIIIFLSAEVQGVGAH